jgi:hypothetical protein
MREVLAYRDEIGQTPWYSASGIGKSHG